MKTWLTTMVVVACGVLPVIAVAGLGDMQSRIGERGVENVASMITCPAVFSVGYADVISPPHAGYAAFNACPAKEKAMFGSVGFGHRINPADSERMRKWLENCGQD